MIKTYNSKHCINGNRRNLVVNTDTKEVYFSGCNAFNIGEVQNNLGIREVNRLHKEYLQDGYKNVSHAHVRDGWKS